MVLGEELKVPSAKMNDPTLMSASEAVAPDLV
jgi:hypothetical protein